MSDALTQQMHESRARRLVEAETAARAAEATIKDLTDRLTDAEWRASCAEDRAREMEIPGILPSDLYTVGTDIPAPPDGPVAVIDLAWGAVYVRHDKDASLWRRMEPGMDKIWSDTPKLLAEGGPFLALPQDAQGLLRCVAAYDRIDREHRNLVHAITGWRADRSGQEQARGSLVEWAIKRIEHADEALRRAQDRVRVLEDQLAYWQGRADS